MRSEKLSSWEKISALPKDKLLERIAASETELEWLKMAMNEIVPACIRAGWNYNMDTADNITRAESIANFIDALAKRKEA